MFLFPIISVINLNPIARRLPRDCSGCLLGFIPNDGIAALSTAAALFKF